MKEESFIFSNCTLVNNELFFVETQTGLPAKMNPDTGGITYCDIMEGFHLTTGDIVDFIHSFDDKVYALETLGNNLMIFDLNNNYCQYISLNCHFHPWGNFAAFERYESDYYIFPKYGNKFFVMDTNNNEITEIANYFEGIAEIQCGCRAENTVWLLPKSAGVIGAYDFLSRKTKIYKLEKTVENCVDAVFADGSIYILNQFGIIYRWDINNERLQEITALETEHAENESMCRIAYAGNKLIILPALGMDIKILDLSTSETEIYYNYPSDFIYHETRWSKYQGACEDNDYYYFAMRLGNYLLKICKQDGKLSWIKPLFPTIEERTKIQTSLIEQKLYSTDRRIICEENNIGIIQLININIIEKRDENEMCIGKIIYEKVRETYES